MDQPPIHSAQGFTLIEAMVAVALVAILSSLALPSYREHVAKGRRLNAQATLYSAAQFMERFYTENHRYDRDTSGRAVTLPDALRQTADGSYALSVSTTGRDSYSVQANPRAAQTGDRCGAFTLTHTGAIAAAQLDCWRR